MDDQVSEHEIAVLASPDSPEGHSRLSQHRGFRDEPDDESDELAPFLDDEEQQLPRRRWKPTTWRPEWIMWPASEGRPGGGRPGTEHGDGSSDDNGDADCNILRQRIPGAKRYQAQRPGTVVALVSVLFFFMVLSIIMGMIPMFRLVEDALCRKYYGDGGGNGTAIAGSFHVASGGRSGAPERDAFNGSDAGPDERLCKVDAIQTQLAWIGGVLTATESIISLIASFPWALLSDRVGRKPIYRLALFSVVLSFLWSALVLWCRGVFPVWFVLFSHFFIFLGGGGNVAFTVMQSVVADVTHDRTSGFVWLSMGAVLASIVGPATGAMLTSVSPWLPVSLTLFLLFPLIMGLTVFLPETLPRLQAEAAEAEAVGRSNLRGWRPDDANYANDTDGVAGLPFGQVVRAHVGETWRRLCECVGVLRGSPAALLLMPTMLFQAAMQTVQAGTLVQLVSKRFGWSLADAGYLFSLRGIVTVVVLALVPGVSALLVRGNGGDSGQADTVAAEGAAVEVPVSAPPAWSRSRPRPRIYRFHKAVVGAVLGGFRTCGLGLSEETKDLVLARGSLVFMAVGTLLMASPSLGVIMAGLVVSTFAASLMPVIRSLVTRYYEQAVEKQAVERRGSRDAVAADTREEVGEATEEGAASEASVDLGGAPHLPGLPGLPGALPSLEPSQTAAPQQKTSDDHTSRLYTLTSMVETLGALLAGPLLAWLFSVGLAHSGAWLGLPFYCVTAVTVLSLACLMCVHSGSGRRADGGENGRGAIAI